MVTVGISNNKPTIDSININFHAHLNHLLKGILAISNTPIKTPDVGVIKFVKPSPMWNAVTVACFDRPIISEISRNIGIISAALAVPEVIIIFKPD